MGSGKDQRDVKWPKTTRAIRSFPKVVEYLQIYDSARTIHLEHIKESGENTTLIYRKANYDFDPSLADRIGARKMGRAKTISYLTRHRPAVVELNEAAMLAAWPSLLLYVSAIKILNRVRNRKTRIVSYAIENNDTIRAFESYTHLGRKLSHLVVSHVATYLLSENSKIAFGSPAAAKNYDRFVTHLPDGIQTKHLLELPGPCQCGPLTKTQTLLFIGEFTHRKGIAQLLALWDTVESIANKSPRSVRLVIIGKGEFESTVRSWSANRDRIELILDPPRSVIHEHLRQARALVLLSQSSARWREQTGLPVGEGLSHGCRIISTDQIGFVEWLRAQGHLVVPQDFDVNDLAHRTLEILSAREDPYSIVRTLPLSDGRVEVDRWLRHPAEG